MEKPLLPSTIKEVQELFHRMKSVHDTMTAGMQRVLNENERLRRECDLLRGQVKATEEKMYSLQDRLVARGATVSNMEEIARRLPAKSLSLEQGDVQDFKIWKRDFEVQHAQLKRQHSSNTLEQSDPKKSSQRAIFGRDFRKSSPKDLISMLWKGMYVKLHHHGNQPKNRYMWLSPDLSNLLWSRAKHGKPLELIHINEITGVRIGSDHQQYFRPEFVKDNFFNNCFTISTITRVVYIETNSAIECEKIVQGLYTAVSACKDSHFHETIVQEAKPVKSVKFERSFMRGMSDLTGMESKILPHESSVNRSKTTANLPSNSMSDYDTDPEEDAEQSINELDRLNSISETSCGDESSASEESGESDTKENEFCNQFKEHDITQVAIERMRSFSSLPSVQQNGVGESTESPHSDAIFVEKRPNLAQRMKLGLHQRRNKALPSDERSNQINLSAVPADTMRLLTSGQLFLKHKRGRSKKRFIWCSSDLRFLLWSKYVNDVATTKAEREKRVKGSIKTSTLLAVRTSIMTSDFHRAADPRRCFALAFRDRSLYLEALTPQQHERWVAALYTLLPKSGNSMEFDSELLSPGEGNEKMEDNVSKTEPESPRIENDARKYLATHLRRISILASEGQISRPEKNSMKLALLQAYKEINPQPTRTLHRTTKMNFRNRRPLPHSTKNQAPTEIEHETDPIEFRRRVSTQASKLQMSPSLKEILQNIII